MLITVVLGLFVLFAWLVYQNQGRFLTALETLLARSSKVTVSVEKVPEITKALLKLPGAVSVTVWNVDMQSNRRWLIGWAAIEPAQAFLQRWEARLQSGYPVFRTTPNSNILMVEALNGGVGCGALGGPETEVTVLQGVGVKWECIVGIPPEVGTFSGAMYIGFDQEISKSMAETLRAPIWTAAQELAK